MKELTITYEDHMEKYENEINGHDAYENEINGENNETYEDYMEEYEDELNR